MGYHQVVLRIDGHLHVVAHHAGALSRGRHGPGIRVGAGDLLVGCVLELFACSVEAAHLVAQLCDLLA
jgi:hypothetical protein